MEVADVEDLKIYFYDNFLTTESILESKEKDAYVNWLLGELQISTGIESGGSEHLYYDNEIFNPMYSELIVKLRMNSLNDVKAFFGFRQNITEPDDTMLESHCGIYVKNGKVYFTTGCLVGMDYYQQKTEIVGLDMTKTYEFKFAYDKLYIKPLPQTEQYLGLPTIKAVERVWKLLLQNSTYPPNNQYHWITAFIKNNVGSEKVLYLNRIIYKEEYAD